MPLNPIPYTTRPLNPIVHPAGPLQVGSKAYMAGLGLGGGALHGAQWRGFQVGGGRKKAGSLLLPDYLMTQAMSHIASFKHS